MTQFLKFLTASILVGLATVFYVGCEKDHTNKNEEVLLDQLNSDNDAQAFVTSLESLRDLMAITLKNKGVTVNEFRGLYLTGNEAEIKKIFEGTGILDAFADVHKKAETFRAKYPALVNDSSCSTCQSGQQQDKTLIFQSLDPEFASDRGCGCCGWNFWKHRACQAACWGAGGSCAVLTSITWWGAFLCGVGAYTCSEACTAAFCR